MQRLLHVPGASLVRTTRSPMVNEATWPQDKVQHDGLELLTFVLALFLSCGIEPRMRKRDVSSALGVCPFWLGTLTWRGWSGCQQMCAGLRLT